MVQTYTFDTKAIIKALLHACKHPSSTVTGVFVGTAPGASVVEGDDTEPSVAAVVNVSDYVPLFHTQTCIGPCCEAALRQVRASLFNQFNCSIELTL